jgi:nucleotide-binding universal stress UspA family protein
VSAELAPTLVVGHDGHATSDHTLAVAADLAERLGARLEVVHSSTLEEFGIDPDIDDFEDQVVSAAAGARRHIEQALAGVGAPWEYRHSMGDPADALAAVADEVDALAIVVGASHRHLLHHALGGGSVTGHLLHGQHRPVLVVPLAGAPR